MHRGGENSYSQDLVEFISNLDIDYSKINNIILQNKTFKILTLDKNQPTKIDYSSIATLEKNLQRHTKLKLSKEKHDLDIQIIRRSEGLMLCLMKLTNNRITEKKLKQGTLRPELAYSLSRIANIQKDDIVMDMFCGYGSIPKAVLKHFKYNMMFISDIDEEKITALKNEFKNNNKKLYIKQRDALELSYFQNDFIDKIITDPPWNIFEKQEHSFVEFYTSMLNEMQRIISPSGKIVLLMGNIEEFEQSLSKVKLLCENKYNILVNGKKANIYVLKK